MDGSTRSTKEASKSEETGSYLPTSLWQWENNEGEEVQEEQPYDFSHDVAINDWNEEELGRQVLQATDSALQKQDHRLILQGLISALVVVLTGVLVIISHIASSLGSLAFTKNSFSALIASAGATIHFYLLVFRVAAEILIVLGIFAVFAHRIVGFALGVYLRTILDPDDIGQYAFNFDWISLRCGLDQNMLVIAGLEWRNPPMFTNTPYFLRIHEINFVIDAVSVYRAVMFQESIKISQIKLDRASIYLEKLSQRSINRAMAAAARKQPISLEKPHTEPVSGLDNSVHKETLSEVDSTDTHSPLASPTKLRLPRKQLPVGLLNLWACMGAQDFAQETSYLAKITKNISRAISGTTNMVQLLGTTVSRINVTGAIYKGAQNVTSTIGSAIGKNFLRTFGGGAKKSTADNNNSASRDRTMTMSTIDSTGTDGNHAVHFAESDSEMEMNASTHSAGKNDSTMTMAETLALLQAEYPDLVLPPLPEEAFDEEDVRHQQELSQHNTPTTSVKVDTKKKKTDPNANKGFGIPYKLEIDQLYVHDIQLHAQDFLNAKHAKDKKAGVIKLKSLTMFRTELTDSPDRRLGGKRRGIYLDDVVWRLVNKLLSELLRHNSIAMMVLLSSAAANNATSVVSSGAGTTKKAFTGLGQVFSGGNKDKSPVRTRSDTSSIGSTSQHGTDSKITTDESAVKEESKVNVHTDSSARSTSPVPVVNPSVGASSTAQSTATSAAQSAFKALNATGADVQKNARNAFQTILKRTGSTKQP